VTRMAARMERMKNHKSEQPGPTAEKLQDILDAAMVSKPPIRRGPTWKWKDERLSADWERTEYRVSNGLDNFLALPLLAYGVGLFSWDAGALRAAFAAWVLAVLLWTPWILLRVHGANPPGNTGRAFLWLALGAAPAFPAAFAAIGMSKLGLALVFPLVYAWGGGGMLLALGEMPRSRRRLNGPAAKL
jgi:hypothetical protein